MIEKSITLTELRHALDHVKIMSDARNLSSPVFMQRAYNKLYQIIKLRDSTNRNEDIIVRLTK